MSHNKRDGIAPGDKGEKGSLTSHARHNESRAQTRRLSAPTSMTANSFEKEAGEAIRRIRLSAQRELELTKQIRAEAERYQRETETKARSQAQMLILQARLATKKEVAELVREANTEIQKALTDIRMIRIIAQEELKLQRKFAAAAKIGALSLSAQKEAEEPKAKQKVAISV